MPVKCYAAFQCLPIHTPTARDRSTAQYKRWEHVAACLPVLDNAEKVCQCGRQLGRLQDLDWHRQSQRLRPILCSVEVDAPAVGADLEPNLHKHGGR